MDEYEMVVESEKMWDAFWLLRSVLRPTQTHQSAQQEMFWRFRPDRAIVAALRNLVVNGALKRHRDLLELRYTNANTSHVHKMWMELRPDDPPCAMADWANRHELEAAEYINTELWKFNEELCDAGGGYCMLPHLVFRLEHVDEHVAEELEKDVLALFASEHALGISLLAKLFSLHFDSDMCHRKTVRESSLIRIVRFIHNTYASTGEPGLVPEAVLWTINETPNTIIRQLECCAVYTPTAFRTMLALFELSFKTLTMVFQGSGNYVNVRSGELPSRSFGIPQLRFEIFHKICDIVPESLKSEHVHNVHMWLEDHTSSDQEMCVVLVRYLKSLGPDCGGSVEFIRSILGRMVRHVQFHGLYSYHSDASQRYDEKKRAHDVLTEVVDCFSSAEDFRCFHCEWTEEMRKRRNQGDGPICRVFFGRANCTLVWLTDNCPSVLDKILGTHAFADSEVSNALDSLTRRYVQGYLSMDTLEAVHTQLPVETIVRCKRLKESLMWPFSSRPELFLMLLSLNSNWSKEVLQACLNLAATNLDTKEATRTLLNAPYFMVPPEKCMPFCHELVEELYAPGGEAFLAKLNENPLDDHDER